MAGTATYLRRSEAHQTLMRGPLGADLVLDPRVTQGRFSLVEHVLAPHALGAPVHTHRNEDEYSIVLEGTLGVEVGDETFEATAGDVIVKPRGVQHAFWNPTDAPAKLLEVIVPGGFERYFSELGQLLGRPGPPDLAALGQLAARYGLELDAGSIPRLAGQHGLDLGAGRTSAASSE